MQATAQPARSLDARVAMRRSSGFPSRTACDNSSASDGSDVMIVSVGSPIVLALPRPFPLLRHQLPDEHRLGIERHFRKSVVLRKADALWKFPALAHRFLDNVYRSD